MIGQLRTRVVAFGVVGFILALAALGAVSIGNVTSPGPYLLALALGLASVVAVLLPWPPRGAGWAAAGVVAAVVAIGLLVVPVLPPGPAGYALWYPAFIVIPLAGVALRGFPGAALAGAVLSAATTVSWALTEPAVGVEDGLYRVVSPTAMVVLAVGIHRLVTQYAVEVDRAHQEQLRAARLSAGARSADAERTLHLAEVEHLTAPLLRRLRDGGEVDERTAGECRLLEAALRDGIRGRNLVDADVRETVWAARSRGVTVNLLDDAGTDPGGSPPEVAAAARRCAVELVEKLEQGVVTVRLAAPDEATIVVLAPGARETGRRCLAGRDSHRHSVLAANAVRVQLHEPDEGPDELLVTLRSG